MATTDKTDTGAELIIAGHTSDHCQEHTAIRWSWKRRQRMRLSKQQANEFHHRMKAQQSQRPPVATNQSINQQVRVSYRFVMRGARNGQREAASRPTKVSESTPARGRTGASSTSHHLVRNNVILLFICCFLGTSAALDASAPLPPLEVQSLMGAQPYTGGEHDLLAQLLRSTSTLSEANHLIDTLINDRVATHKADENEQPQKQPDYSQVRASVNLPSAIELPGSMASDSQSIHMLVPAPESTLNQKGLLDEILQASGRSMANYNVHYDDEPPQVKTDDKSSATRADDSKQMAAGKPIEQSSMPIPQASQPAAVLSSSVITGSDPKRNPHYNLFSLTDSMGAVDLEKLPSNILRNVNDSDGLNNNESISSLVIRNPSSNKLIANYTHLINHEQYNSGLKPSAMNSAVALHNQLLLAESIRSRVNDAIRLVESPATVTTRVPLPLVGETSQPDSNENASGAKLSDVSILTASVLPSSQTTTALTEATTAPKRTTKNLQSANQTRAFKSSFDDINPNEDFPEFVPVGETIQQGSSRLHKATRVKPSSKLQQQQAVLGAINNLQDETEKMRLGKKNETGVHKIVFINSMPHWTPARIKNISMTTTTTTTTPTSAPSEPSQPANAATETYVEMSVFADTFKPTTLKETQTDIPTGLLLSEKHVSIETYETATTANKRISTTKTSASIPTSKQPKKKNESQRKQISGRRGSSKQTKRKQKVKQQETMMQSTTAKMSSTVEFSPTQTETAAAQSPHRSAKKFDLAHLLLGTTSALDRLLSVRGGNMRVTPSMEFAASTEPTPTFTSPYLASSTQEEPSSQATAADFIIPTKYDDDVDQGPKAERKWQAVELPLHEHLKPRTVNQTRYSPDRFNAAGGAPAAKFVTFQRKHKPSNNNSALNRAQTQPPNQQQRPTGGNQAALSNGSQPSIRRSTVTTSTNSPLNLETTDYSQVQVVLPTSSMTPTPFLDSTQPIHHPDMVVTTPGVTTTTTTTTTTPEPTRRLTLQESGSSKRSRSDGPLANKQKMVVFLQRDNRPLGGNQQVGDDKNGSIDLRLNERALSQSQANNATSVRISSAFGQRLDNSAPISVPTTSNGQSEMDNANEPTTTSGQQFYTSTSTNQSPPTRAETAVMNETASTSMPFELIGQHDSNPSKQPTIQIAKPKQRSLRQSINRSLETRNDSHTTSYGDTYSSSSPSQEETPSAFIYQSSPARNGTVFASAQSEVDSSNLPSTIAATSPLLPTPSIAPQVSVGQMNWPISNDLLPSILFHNRLSNLFQYKQANRSSLVGPTGKPGTSSSQPSYFQFEYRTREPTLSRSSERGQSATSKTPARTTPSPSIFGSEMVDRLLKLNNGKPTRGMDSVNVAAEETGADNNRNSSPSEQDRQFNLGYYGKFYGGQTVVQSSSNVTKSFNRISANHNNRSTQITSRLSRREKGKPVAVNREDKSSVESSRQSSNEPSESAFKSGNKEDHHLDSTTLSSTDNSKSNEGNEEENKSTLSINQQQRNSNNRQQASTSGSAASNEAADQVTKDLVYLNSSTLPPSSSTTVSGSAIEGPMSSTTPVIDVYVKPLNIDENEYEPAIVASSSEEPAAEKNRRLMDGANPLFNLNLTARKRRREPPVLASIIPTTDIEDSLRIRSESGANQTSDAPILSVTTEYNKAAEASIDTANLEGSMAALGNLFRRLPSSQLGETQNYPEEPLRKPMEVVESNNLQQKRRRESQTASRSAPSVESSQADMLTDGSHNWRSTSLSPLVDEYKAKSLLRTMINLGVPTGNGSHADQISKSNRLREFGNKQPNEQIRLVKLEKFSRNKSRTSTTEATTSTTASSTTAGSVPTTTPTNRKPNVESSTEILRSSTTKSPTTTATASSATQTVSTPSTFISRSTTTQPAGSPTLLKNGAFSRWRSLGETQLRPLALDKKLYAQLRSSSNTSTTSQSASSTSLRTTESTSTAPMSNTSVNYASLDRASTPSSHVPSFASLPGSSTSPTTQVRSVSESISQSPIVEFFTSSESPTTTTTINQIGDSHTPPFLVVSSNGKPPMAASTTPSSTTKGLIIDPLQTLDGYDDSTMPSFMLRPTQTSVEVDSEKASGKQLNSAKSESNSMHVERSVDQSSQTIDSGRPDLKQQATQIINQLRNQRYVDIHPPVPPAITASDRNSTFSSFSADIFAHPTMAVSHLSSFQQMAIMTIGLCCIIIVACLLVIAITIKCRSAFVSSSGRRSDSRPNRLDTERQRRRRDKRKFMAEARTRGRSIVSGGKQSISMAGLGQRLGQHQALKNKSGLLLADLSSDAQACSSTESTASICVSTSSDGLKFINLPTESQQVKRTTMSQKPGAAKQLGKQTTDFLTTSKSVANNYLQRGDHHNIDLPSRAPRADHSGTQGASLRKQISGTITSRLLRLHLPRLLPYFALDYTGQRQQAFHGDLQQQHHPNREGIPSRNNTRQHHQKLDLTLGDLLGMTGSSTTKQQPSQGKIPQTGTNSQASNFHLRASGSDKLQKCTHVPLPKAKRIFMANLDLQKRNQSIISLETSKSTSVPPCACATCTSSGWLINSNSGQQSLQSVNPCSATVNVNYMGSKGKLPFGTASSVLRQSSVAAKEVGSCANPPGVSHRVNLAVRSRNRLHSDCMTDTASQMDNEHHLLIENNHQQQVAQAQLHHQTNYNNRQPDDSSSECCNKLTTTSRQNHRSQQSHYNVTGAHFSHRPDLSEGLVDQVHRRRNADGLIEEEEEEEDGGSVEVDGVSSDSDIDNYYNVASQANYAIDGHPTFRVQNDRVEELPRQHSNVNYTRSVIQDLHLAHNDGNLSRQHHDHLQAPERYRQQQAADQNNKTPATNATTTADTSGCNCNLILYPL